MKKLHCSIVILFFVLFSSSLYSQQLPASFDLRNFKDNNYVTSVKNQSGGTCWTHGAMAAIEGNLLKTGVWAAAGESGEPDLAEYHLDWWNGFNQHYNEDTTPTYGGGLEVHNGGDYLITSAYLSRGEGAVRDIDGQSYSSAPVRASFRYHYYYVPKIEWFTPNSGANYRAIIKQKIMEHGVMGTCMCYSGPFMRTDLGYTHYQSITDIEDPNHAIAIIGWDDEKITQFDKPGAWLCKNSWGAGWGLAGYFWISYHDKHSTVHPEMGAVSFQNAETMKYDHIYYHDYHGWRGTLLDVDEAFNVFFAKTNESLKSVSFFTAADNVEFTVIIFDQFVNGELTVPLASKTGVSDFIGFNTIDLDSPVPLSAGDDFFVYVKLSHGGHPIDRTSEVSVLLGTNPPRTIVKSSANPGESYYWLGSSWTDLYDYSFNNYSWDHTANFCIKALTVDVSPSEVNSDEDVIPETFVLAQNFPNPFNSTTTIRYAVQQPGYVTLKIYNMLGEEIVTLVESNEATGWKTVNWSGTDNFGRAVNSGVYVYRLEIEGKAMSRKLMVLR